MQSSNLLRHLSDFEKASINPMNKLFVQLALEFTNREYLPIFLTKIKNSISGLYLKSDGDHFINNFKDPEQITIHQIPQNVKSLSDCCEWIYRTYSPDPNYSLASIAADKTRLIINSSHSLTDGGFFVNLIKDIQNPLKQNSFSQKVTVPRDIMDNELLKEELKKFKEKYNSNEYKLKQTDFTYLNLQEQITLPDKYNDIPYRFTQEINYKELSPFIYNKKTGKINQMTDLLCAGLCLSINAKNGNFGPIGFCNCFDFRNLIPKEKIDFSFGNSFSIYFIAIQNLNKSNSINEICSILRKKFNYLKSNNLLYKEYLYPFDYCRIDSPIAVVSNLGKIKFKSPIKDFYLQDTEKDASCKPIIQLTCYSKINENINSNNLVLYLRAANSVASVKNTKDIFDTLVYFLKNVDPSKKACDVFDELIHFQNSL